MLDLWRGKLSWRRVEVLIGGLPREASLFESVIAARPVEEPDEAPLVTVVDPLLAMQYGPLEHLALSIKNSVDAFMVARMSEDERNNWKPSLPPGYAWTDEPSDDLMTVTSDIARAYFASLRPDPGEG